MVTQLKIKDGKRTENVETPNNFIQKCKIVSNNGGLFPVESSLNKSITFI